MVLELTNSLHNHLYRRQPDFNDIVFRTLLPLVTQRLTVDGDGYLRLDLDAPYHFTADHAALPDDVFDWIEGGLCEFHTAQHYFDSFLQRDRKQGEDTHESRVYRDYHEDVIEHFRRIIDRAPLIGGRAVRQSLERIVASHRHMTEWNLDRPIYLALRHGDLRIRNQQPNQKVLLTKSRIKNMQRAAEKAARYICRAVIRYNALREYVDNETWRKTAWKKGSAKRSVETLAGMRAHGLLPIDCDIVTLRDTLAVCDPLSYLFIAGRVKDIFGVTYVTPTIADAKHLVHAIETGEFEGGHCVVRGVLGEHAGDSIRYRNAYLVEDNFRRDEKLKADGNNRIDLYTQLRPGWFTDRLRHSYRFEVACTSLRFFADDELGGPGSHLLYEQAQYRMVEEWKRTNPDLHRFYNELVAALTGVAALQDRVYGLPLHANQVHAAD